MASLIATDDIVRMQWASRAQQAASFTVFMVAFGVVAGIIGMRWRHLTLFLSPKFKHASWLCNTSLIIAKIAAVVFIVGSGLLQFGVGMSADAVCKHGSAAAVSFFFLAKFMIFVFLLERVFVVRNKDSHFSSRAWIGGAVIYVAGIPIFAYLIAAKRHEVLPSGVCQLGLSTGSSVAYIILDGILNGYLTIAFVWPLLRTQIRGSRLQRIAVQSMAGSAISLATSVANISLIIAFKMESAWLLLTTCTIDLLINVVALAVLTTPLSSDSPLNRRGSSFQFTPPGTPYASSHQESGKWQHSAPPTPALEEKSGVVLASAQSLRRRASAERDVSFVSLAGLPKYSSRADSRRSLDDPFQRKPSFSRHASDATILSTFKEHLDESDELEADGDMHEVHIEDVDTK